MNNFIQVRSIIKKCNSKLAVLKKIQEKIHCRSVPKNCNTPILWSIVFLCPSLDNRNHPFKMNNSSFKPMRIALNDFRYSLSRPELSKNCNCAMPTEWVRYQLAFSVIKIYTYRIIYLYACLPALLI